MEGERIFGSKEGVALCGSSKNKVVKDLKNMEMVIGLKVKECLF